MAHAVYVLCFMTSVACAALLLRGHAKTKVPLLWWSGLCFAVLGVENALLFIDRVLLHNHDLSLVRATVGFCAPSLLLVGLIWEAE